MLSIDLRQIIAAKNAILVRQKVQISSKIYFATNPEFCQFRQISSKIKFSSRRPVFVISSVFRQKRNPLEPS